MMAFIRFILGIYDPSHLRYQKYIAPYIGQRRNDSHRR